MRRPLSDYSDVEGGDALKNCDDSYSEESMGEEPPEDMNFQEDMDVLDNPVENIGLSWYY